MCPEITIQPYNFKMVNIKLHKITVDKYKQRLTEAFELKLSSVELSVDTFDRFCDRLVERVQIDKEFSVYRIESYNLEKLFPFKCNSDSSEFNKQLFSFLRKVVDDDSELEFRVYTFPRVKIVRVENHVNENDHVRINITDMKGGKLMYDYDKDKNWCDVEYTVCKNRVETLNQKANPYNIEFTLNYSAKSRQLSIVCKSLELSLCLCDTTIDVLTDKTPELWKCQESCIVGHALNKKCGFDMDGVLKKLNKFNSNSPTTVLSGGFLMQTILSENWGNRVDVDLFTIKVHKTKEMLKDYVAEEWRVLGNSSSKEKSEKYSKVDGIKAVYESTLKNGCTIQLIECGNIWHVLESFDSDICKNAYTGNELLIKDSQNLFDKKMKMKQDTTPERLSKYALRGFLVESK